jgi:hypothetical protein
VALLKLAEMFAKGLDIRGHQVVIDVAALPAVAPYRELLQYVKKLDVTTDRGTLYVRFEASID